MSAVLYHLTEDGPKRCTATVRECPLGGAHFETQAEASKAHEELMGSAIFSKVTKTTLVRDPKDGFSSEVFYGELSPREMQIEALNGTANALIEDGNTQLVAACGTGKSFMGRQLMRLMMEEENARGIAVVLTSSIKLAKDTSSDLRPDKNGRYDHSMGEYDEDYVVIEVHSDSREFMKNGAVSMEKIAEKWETALAEGKKVVIVSTYESSNKVQEVQALLTSKGVSTEVDLLMNDEAHNILGQQRSQSAKTEGLNSGYRSFHNEIPGAIQSRHRLYATATPVVAEMVSDDPSAVAEFNEPGFEAERIAAMQARAALMDTDPKARITVYSDDSAIVGKVGGYISQKTAIDTVSLAQPDYQLRSALIKGDLTKAKDGYVDASGNLMGSPVEGKVNLSVQTYAAVSSTLNAMASDQAPGVNPVHNALAYCGSIEQAKAFRDEFKAVALAQSGGISLVDALRTQKSADPEMRRMARMRLLAEHVDVQAAYSGEESEVKKAREVAFGMFKGKSFTADDAAQGWSPHKRVLANVDIFSEGVSINEIDTVIISDDEKTSERSMTQAIGRAIRRVPSNPYKSTGHVIIPQALGANGEELNGGSVALAAYGATRVERGVAISKLAGKTATPDNSTSITRYSAEGAKLDNQLASSVAKQRIASPEDVIVAHTLDRAHKELLKLDSTYKDRSASEQYALMSSHIREKATAVSNKDAYWAYAANHVGGKSVNELHAIRQSNRVLVSALGANDIGSLSPELTKTFIDRGVLQTPSGAVAEPTQKEKRALIKKNKTLIAAALSSGTTAKTHPELHALVASSAKPIEVMKAFQGRPGSSSESLASAERSVSEALVNDTRVEELYKFVTRSQEKGESYSLIHDAKHAASLSKDIASVGELVKNRAATSAVEGESRYELNRAMVRRVGDLTSSALAALS